MHWIPNQRLNKLMVNVCSYQRIEYIEIDVVPLRYTQSHLGPTPVAPQGYVVPENEPFPGAPFQSLQGTPFSAQAPGQPPTAADRDKRPVRQSTE
jgi:hypothetical protein